MGRIHEHDERGAHEGFIVGYVPRDWVPLAAARAIDSTRNVAALEPYGTRGVLRELGMLEADRNIEVHGVYVIGYGCDCGWRSPYYEAGNPLEWTPCVVHWPEWLEERLAEKYWRPHVTAELERTERLNRGHSTGDSVHLALDLSRRLASDLQLFFGSLGNDDFNRIMARQPNERAESALTAIGELEDQLKLLLLGER